ncbi:MAG TPA: efflux RND transporter periplasmic adaptor subunit [Candidatus Kapabacteria bacterium]|nr:efflux RND transporter periplasmic adaptor subunit [Candidatus Kapabacteria bacterium]
MRTTIHTIALSTLAIAAALSVNSCNKTNGAEQPGATGDVFTVTVAKIETAPMAATFRATGSLEGIREAVVNSETNGRIVAVNANNGVRVGTGSAIVTVDNELKAIAVQQADAARLAAEAGLEKAKLDATRTTELCKTGAATKSQCEMADLQVKANEAQLKAAESQESLAKRQLSDAVIKAPFGGVVAMRYVNLGELLKSGDKIAALVDDSKMKLKINIGEMDLPSINIGDPVSIIVDALPNKSFDGKITTIADKADAARSYTVEVELDNPNKELKSGMFARAEIKREADRNVPTVPATAVIYNGTRTQAYVVDDKGIAHLKGIKIGVTTPDRAEIVEGLQPNDVVVSFGQSQLKDGVKVRIQN